jgi:hypothetical protein
VYVLKYASEETVAIDEMHVFMFCVFIGASSSFRLSLSDAVLKMRQVG